MPYKTSSAASLSFVFSLSVILVLIIAIFAIEISSDTENNKFVYTDDLGSWDMQITGDNTVKITKINLTDLKIDTLKIPKTAHNNAKAYTVSEIGPQAGMNLGCKAEKIVIPNTVEKIGYNAFWSGLPNLKIIDFEDGSKLREIEQYAFEGCGTAKSFIEQEEQSSIIEFPKELSIEKEVEIPAGEGVTIEAVTGTESVTKIAFLLKDSNYQGVSLDGKNVNSLSYPEFGAFFIISGTVSERFTLRIDPALYTWLAEKLPDLQEGYFIQIRAANDSYSPQMGLVDLFPTKNTTPDRLPDYLQLTIPSSLVKIGDYALNRVQKLSFEENSSLQYIGTQAFQMLNDAFEVTFPNTITYLGVKPFNSCTSIRMESGGTYELLSTGEIIHKETGKVIVYVGDSIEYSFPEQIKSVGDLAYSDTKISKVILRDGISFGLFPFMGCTISEIDFGSVTSIQDYMFGLTKMESLAIPKNIRTIGEKAFFEIEGLTTLEFEADSCLEFISQYAFSSNSQLKTVTFVSSSQDCNCEIGQAAFFNCNALEKVEVGDFRIRYISDFAFTKHNDGRDLSKRFPAMNFNTESGILIPAETTYVGAYSFSHAFKITAASITIKTYLGYGTIDAQKTNTGFPTMPVTDYSISFEEGSSVISIGDGAFIKINGMDTVDLSNCNELTDIGERAFYDTYLSTLILPADCKIASLTGFGAAERVYGKAKVFTGDIEGLIPASIQTVSNVGWFEEMHFQEGSELITLEAPINTGDWTIYALMKNLEVDLTNCLKLESVEVYGTMTLPMGVYDISIKPVTGDYTITNASDVVVEPSDNRVSIRESTIAINRSILGNIAIDCDEKNPTFSLNNGMLLKKLGTSKTLVSLQKGTDRVEISEASDVTGIATGAFARTSLDEMVLSKNLDLSERIFDGISPESDPTVMMTVDLTFDGDEFEGDYSSITFFVRPTQENWNVLSSLGTVYFGRPAGDSTVYVPAIIPGVGVIDILDDDSDIRVTMPGGYTLYDMQIDLIRGSADMEYDAERISISDVRDRILVLSLQAKDRRSGELVSVIFDADGGTVNGSKTSVLTISRGLTILDSEIPAAKNERRNFEYWSDKTGAEFDFSTPIQRNTQLTAVWGSVRDPVITVQDADGTVLSDGVPVTTITAKGTITLSFVPNAGYEPISWIVNGTESGSALDLLQITDPDTDVTVSVKSRYYASSTTVPSTVDRDLPDYQDMFRTIYAYSLGGTMDMSGMNWKGHSSVPLIVDNYVYIRVKDTLYKAESDTGYIVATARSAETIAYYHHLCYGDGMIVDTQTSKVFDLDLKLLFTLKEEITGAEYHDGYFYTSGKTLKRFPADSSIAIDGIMPLETVGEFSQKVFGSYGFSHSVFVGDTIYRVSADGNMRGIVAMGIGEDNLGSTGFVELKDITGYYLDDGWISYNEGYLYLTGYTHGLFGAVATTGDDKVAYVKADGTEFGTPGSYTFDGMQSFASEAVFIDGYAFVNVGYLYMLKQNQDGSLTYLADTLGCGTHGSIVVKKSTTVEDDYTVYMIPYSSFKESMVVVHCYKQGNEWKMDRHAMVHTGAQYNSQVIRSDLEGRLVWYNDSGKVACWTTPEKNRFFFFIEKDGMAQWYESYGATAADALKALGSDVVTLTVSNGLATMFGEDADRWNLYYLKNNIFGYQDPRGSPNGWKETDNLFDTTLNAFHYYAIITSTAPSSADYRFVDGSDIGTYTFADNVGDRSIVGKKLIAASDVFTIRFYDGEEEIENSALIGAKGSKVDGSFPSVYKADHIANWYVKGTDDRVTELPKTFSGNLGYEVRWVEAAYELKGTVKVDGDTTYFVFSANSKSGGSNLVDARVLLIVKYDNDFFTKSFSGELDLTDGTSTTVLGVGNDRLSYVVAYLVEGTPTKPVSTYAEYQYTISGTGS